MHAVTKYQHTIHSSLTHGMYRAGDQGLAVTSSRDLVNITGPWWGNMVCNMWLKEDTTTKFTISTEMNYILRYLQLLRRTHSKI